MTSGSVAADWVGEGMDLAGVLAAWVGRGDPNPLARRLDRELDAQGVPRRWPVSAWWPCLAALAEAKARRPSGWPDALGERVAGLFRAALRFSRPDGSAVFGPGPAEDRRGNALRGWADLLAGPDSASVVGRWFPTSVGARRRVRAGVPPLPAIACEDRPLAILRA